MVGAALINNKTGWQDPVLPAESGKHAYIIPQYEFLYFLFLGV